MFARRAATGKFVESGITADEIRVPRACFEYAFNPSLSLSLSLLLLFGRIRIASFWELAFAQRTANCPKISRGRDRRRLAAIAARRRDDFITIINVETHRDYRVLTTLISQLENFSSVCEC